MNRRQARFKRMESYITLALCADVIIFLSLSENLLSLKVSVVMLISAMLFFLSGCHFYGKFS